MKVVYIISDNQYFSIGFLSLLPPNLVRIVSPREFLELRTPVDSAFFLYIRDRDMHQRVCHTLRYTTGLLIFFIPAFIPEKRSALMANFWPARMAVATFCHRMSKVSWFVRPRSIRMTAKSSDIRLIKVAKGLDNYLLWLKAQSFCPKKIHSHHRMLIKSVGLDRVNIHTLFLSEYIARVYINL